MTFLRQPAHLLQITLADVNPTILPAAVLWDPLGATAAATVATATPATDGLLSLPATLTTVTAVRLFGSAQAEAQSDGYNSGTALAGACAGGGPWRSWMHTEIAGKPRWAASGFSGWPSA